MQNKPSKKEVQQAAVRLSTFQNELYEAFKSHYEDHEITDQDVFQKGVKNGSIVPNNKLERYYAYREWADQTILGSRVERANTVLAKMINEELERVLQVSGTFVVSENGKVVFNRSTLLDTETECKAEIARLKSEVKKLDEGLPTPGDRKKQEEYRSQITANQKIIENAKEFDKIAKQASTTAIDALNKEVEKITKALSKHGEEISDHVSARNYKRARLAEHMMDASQVLAVISLASVVVAVLLGVASIFFPPLTILAASLGAGGVGLFGVVAGANMVLKDSPNTFRYKGNLFGSASDDVKFLVGNEEGSIFSTITKASEVFAKQVEASCNKAALPTPEPFVNAPEFAAQVVNAQATLIYPDLHRYKPSAPQMTPMEQLDAQMNAAKQAKDAVDFATDVVVQAAAVAVVMAAGVAALQQQQQEVSRG